MGRDPLVTFTKPDILRIQTPPPCIPLCTHCTWKRRFRIGGVPVHRAVAGEELDWPGTQSMPRPTPGAMPGVPSPRFGWIYTYADHTGLSAFGTSMLRPSGKQGNELLLAERPVLLAERPADQRRQRRPMPCCSSAAARCRAPCTRAGPRPTKRDAAPRVRSALHRRRPRSSSRRRITSLHFPLYAASRAGKQDLTIFNAIPFA